MTLNVNDFREAAEKGLLKRQVKGDFELFNYTSETQYSGAWDEVTLEARGIVFENGHVVCRPMRKFFNHHEKECQGFAQPKIALVKLDGTLLNVWFDLSGGIRVSTRGSLDNEYIDGAWELIIARGLDVYLSMHKDVTWSFEYTYPQERFTMPSVIPHADERLTLINMRMRDGLEVEAEMMPDMNVAMYPDKSHFYDIFTEFNDDASLMDGMVELAKLLPYTEEGWVLSAFDGFTNQRMKIKGIQYVTMHRVIHGMTERAVGVAWYAGMTFELVGMLYEPHASLLRSKFDVYDSELNNIIGAINEWVSGYILVTKEFSRKDFVMQAQQDIPDLWQLAIKSYYDGDKWLDAVNLYIVKKLTGKAPRTWELPLTDDVG